MDKITTFFFKFCILPELVGKCYTKPVPNVLSQESQQPSTSLSPNTLNVNSENSAQEIWCYCREPESGKMIMCENSSCKIEWFQF